MNWELMKDTLGKVTKKMYGWFRKSNAEEERRLDSKRKRTSY